MIRLRDYPSGLPGDREALARRVRAPASTGVADGLLEADLLNRDV
jgi:hypothetical protein